MRIVRDERGQTIVEWLGGLVLLTLLVLLVAAARPSHGERLRCAVGAQIERILSIDASGDCKRAEPKIDPGAARQILHTNPGTPQDRLDRQALRPSAAGG
jgi:hypothetical protein